MVFIKRIGKGTALVSLTKGSTDPISISFPEMEIKSMDGVKVLNLKTNLYNEDNLRVYRFIESIDTSIANFFNTRKTYVKSPISDDAIKVKVLFKGHMFQVDSERLITDLNEGSILNDVVIELKNLYILDKGYYDIVGSIWVIKSFN